jgi:outer membrane lipoprotein-sorting protein
MIPGVRGRIGCALLVANVLAGCAALPPAREAGQAVSNETRDALVARLQIREAQIRSLRGIAAVEITVSEETRRFREALALKSDGRFRLETLNAVGLPDLILASDGNRVVVHGASGAVGSQDGCDLLERLLGLRLSPTTLVRLLAGLPPRRVGRSVFASYLPGRQAYLLEDEDSDAVQRLYLDPSGTLLGGEIWAGRRGLSFDFAEVRDVDGIAVPMRIVITQARRPVRVTLAYEAIDINPMLADQFFPAPPAGPEKSGGC